MRVDAVTGSIMQQIIMSVGGGTMSCGFHMEFMRMWEKGRISLV